VHHNGHQRSISEARTCSGIWIGHTRIEASRREIVDQSLTKSLKDAGYTTVDHGATKTPQCCGGEHYYLLSPKTDAVTAASQMPAIIGESLFFDQR